MTAPRGRPRVVVHTAVSVDGATTGFAADVGTYYRLAALEREDVTLTGADTVLAQEAALAGAAGPGPAPDGPLLAVVDGRARVRRWAELRAAGRWSAVLAVGSRTTPPRQLPVEELRRGEDRVDLGALLGELARRGARTVRVDSGGALTGALLDAGLVDRVSLLVHPVLAAGPRWYGAATTAARLDLAVCRSLPGGLVHLRYRVRR